VYYYLINFINVNGEIDEHRRKPSSWQLYSNCKFEKIERDYNRQEVGSNLSEFKIGVIGGSGYIGSALVHHLSKTFTVKVLDTRPFRESLKLEGRAVYQRCDISKHNEVEQGLKDVDLVIHTAIVQIPTINEEKKLGYRVNFLGTQNVCKIVDENPLIKGMILTGSWHVFGERELNGMIDEEFGFRPDKVESRARLYAMSKIAQEIMVRFYDEMSEKIYGVIRMGTVLGEGMPEKTAANIFISRGLKGKPITPYKHSMHRPMLYVDINDVCEAYNAYATKILKGEIHKEANSLAHVINLCWPKPITIIELSHMVRDAIIRYTKGKVKPEIEIIDTGEPILHTAKDMEKIEVDISRVQQLLNLRELVNPQNTIKRIVKRRVSLSKSL